MPKTLNRNKIKKPGPALANLKVWKLEDAKARFSEVVKLAREKAPQRVTVRGEDAVVVISSKDYAKLKPLSEQPSLHALLSQSPFNKLKLKPKETRAPVRDISL